MRHKEKVVTEVLNTKVTPQTSELFTAIANRIGLTPYAMLNLMVSSVIRMADDRHNLSEETEKMMHIFNQFTGWRQLTSIASPGEKEIVEAIYIYTEEGKRGRVAVMVKNSMFDDRETFNAQQILEEVIKACDPYMAKRLDALSEEFDTNSMLETIHVLIDRQHPDSTDDYIRELFSDCARSEYGKQTTPIKYVPHNSKKIENYEQGQDISSPGLFREMGDTEQDAEG